MSGNIEKFLPQFAQIPPVASSVLPHIPWVVRLSWHSASHPPWHTASETDCTLGVEEITVMITVRYST